MKVQFNKKNFFKLQHQLYGMCDEALKTESEIIQHNFNTWVMHHFKLSKEQWNYLETLTHQIKLILSSDISFAIENRIPISLNDIVIGPICHSKNSEIMPKGIIFSQAIAHYSTCGTLQININYVNNFG